MSNRPDLFTTIHKGLRWWMGDLTSRLGATDFSNAGAAAPVIAEVIECLDTLDSHAMHEETFIAPVLDARAPFPAHAWHGEHETLDHLTAALRSQAGVLLNAAPEQATAFGLALYRAFARYTSEMYVHLDDEETRLMPLLWSLCSDEEIGGIMAAFRVQHGAESALLYARLASAFTPAERILLGV